MSAIPGKILSSLRRRRVKTVALAATVGVLLLAVLPPAATRAAKLLFPTRATVTGLVELDGRPASRAALRLDGDNGSTTDTDGRFQLTGVGEGRHRLRIQAGGAVALDFEFTVPAGARATDVGVITLDRSRAAATGRQPTDAAKAELPEVAGLNQGTAIGRLQRALLKPRVRAEPSDSVPAGKVIGTEPAAGTKVGKGATITVLVSSGPG